MAVHTMESSWNEECGQEWKEDSRAMLSARARFARALGDLHREWAPGGSFDEIRLEEERVSKEYIEAFDAFMLTPAPNVQHFCLKWSAFEGEFLEAGPGESRHRREWVWLAALKADALALIAKAQAK